MKRSLRFSQPILRVGAVLLAVSGLTAYVLYAQQQANPSAEATPASSPGEAQAVKRPVIMPGSKSGVVLVGAEATASPSPQPSPRPAVVMPSSKSIGQPVFSVRQNASPSPSPMPSASPAPSASPSPKPSASPAD